MPLAQPGVIGAPFCSAGTLTTDYVLPPAVASGTVASQPNGVPPIQELPLTAGGLPVKRNEWNGTMRFYTNFIVWLNAGGQFTFDAAVVTAAGGYSIGMILFDYATNRQVISLINNNTNNFVTTPSFIDNTNWAFYPRDLFVRNVPILGNTPTSQVIAQRNGAYTESFLQSTNGAANHFASMYTSYADGGNGVFKPTSFASSRISADTVAYYQNTAAGINSNYSGLYQGDVNILNATTSAVRESFYDNASTSFVNQIYVTDDNFGARTSGIFMRPGQRPVLSNYGATVTNTNLGAIQVLSDFNNLKALTGYQRLPNGVIIQWGTISQNQRSTATYNLPIAFPVGGALAVAGWVAGLGNTTGYTLGCTFISTTQIQIQATATAAVGGNNSGYYIAIGY